MLEAKDTRRKCSKKINKIFSRQPPLKKDIRARRRRFSAKIRRSPKKKGLRRISSRFVPLSKEKWKEGHGHGQFLQIKKSAVLEPRTEHFWRLVGFEAKDFKTCPQGQGRPRGLYLCCDCWFIIVLNPAILLNWFYALAQNDSASLGVYQ